jgi:hypothetical protein
LLRVNAETGVGPSIASVTKYVTQLSRFSHCTYKSKIQIVSIEFNSKVPIKFYSNIRGTLVKQHHNQTIKIKYIAKMANGKAKSPILFTNIAFIAALLA